MTAPRSEAELLSLQLAEFQQLLGYASREPLADLLATNVARFTGRLDGAPVGAARREDDIARLRRQGLVDLGAPLAQEQAAEIRAYFSARPCFNNHVPAQSDLQPRSLGECRSTSRHASYATADVIGAPYLIELANSEAMLSIAEGYLGCTPTLYSVNAFWSFPGMTRPTRGLQTFHRDFDDYRFCTLFVFLTDTHPEDGAHTYLAETHRPDAFRGLVERLAAANPDPASLARLRGIDEATLFSQSELDLDAACDPALAPAGLSVHGVAGSAVIEDTYGLHRGAIPATPRLLFWARYGLYQNVAWFKNSPGQMTTAPPSDRIPATPYHRYVNRLLIPDWRD